MRTKIVELAVFAGLLAGGLAPAIGQEPGKDGALLRWKFQPGEVIHFVTTQETSSVSRPEGGPAMTSTMSQTIDLRWTVELVSPDGVAKLTQKIDRVRAKIVNHDQPAPFLFDSQAAPVDETDPFVARVVPVLKALAGSEIGFTMNSRGDVADVEVAETLREALKTANPTAGESPETRRGLIAQAILTTPREAAAAGTTWSAEVKIPLPTLGELVMTRNYTDQGPETAGSPVHKIELKTTVAHEAAEGAPLEMKLTDQKGTGLYRFDAQAGRVVFAQVEDSMTMTLGADRGPKVEQTTANKVTTELKPAAEPAGKSPTAPLRRVEP